MRVPRRARRSALLVALALALLAPVGPAGATGNVGYIRVSITDVNGDPGGATVKVYWANAQFDPNSGYTCDVAAPALQAQGGDDEVLAVNEDDGFGVTHNQVVLFLEGTGDNKSAWFTGVQANGEDYCGEGDVYGKVSLLGSTLEAPKEVSVQLVCSDTPALVEVGSPTVAGTTKVGRVLTVQNSVPPPAGGYFSYQWYRNEDSWDEIGTDAPTYTTKPGDLGEVVFVEVRAHSSCASDAAYTPSTAPIAKGTFTKAPTPTISGVFRKGHTLKAKPGTWAPAPDKLRYQWLRGTSPIHGATSRAYTLVRADVGKRLKVQLTAVKTAYLTTMRVSSRTPRIKR